MGTNINGPSLIRVPDWIDRPLGRYYLYFAHHQGTYIRLAYADDPAGPWRIHAPGTLRLDQTPFDNHIASPDVHVDHAHRRIVMYYHGCCNRDPAIPWGQYTCAALSPDGLSFESRREALCPAYLRMFRWRGRSFGLTMPGELYRSADGLSGFEPRDQSLADAFCQPRRNNGEAYKARHFAVQVAGDTLRVIYSRAGDCPEHLLLTTIALSEDWRDWRIAAPVSLLMPEHAWEGADRPIEASRAGSIHEPVHQLRDPAVFEEDGRTYLLYTVAGEAGIALAELRQDG